jgi:formylglycine-generating enzyme required for sulfatase activity
MSGSEEKKSDDTPPVCSPSELCLILPGDVPLELVLIPAGSFMMGSASDEPGRLDCEGPEHQVTFVRPFYMGKYEVTQEQWEAVMESNPSYFKGGGSLPVESVSWNDCQGFLCKLNSHVSDARGVSIVGAQGSAPPSSSGPFRLPSDAEWEYACRAGTSTPFAFGQRLSTSAANYDGNYPLEGCWKGEYREKTTLVTSFKPNAFGLYDMHGNVYEWCQDWYHDSYVGAPVDGSAWELPKGSARVLRGGSWSLFARSCRSAYRSSNKPDSCNRFQGFRLAAGQQ